MDAPPEEDTERIAKLREQRRADRERRRRAHQQAQAAASDERQAPAQADNSQEAPAQAVQKDEEPVVARAVPINAVVVADVAPVAAVAVVPPAPPAPQEERYPDVDAELLGEEIRRERTQIDGFDARATAVCDLLAEAERKLMEAERMEAALLADDAHAERRAPSSHARLARLGREAMVLACARDAQTLRETGQRL